MLDQKLTLTLFNTSQSDHIHFSQGLALFAPCEIQPLVAPDVQFSLPKDAFQINLSVCLSFACRTRRSLTFACLLPPDTFHINPRLHLVLTVPEEVVVSLTQHTVTEPRVVGFTVYPVTNGSVDAIDNSFFKKKSLVNSQYTNGRQVRGGDGARRSCGG